MALTTILMTVRDNILSQLEQEPMSAKQLKQKMPGVATSTLYKALSQLQTEGRIRKIPKISGREDSFALGTNHTSDTLMPNLIFNKINVKANLFLNPKAFDETLQGINKNTIGALARIFLEAVSINEGQATEVTSKSLKRIRTQLNMALTDTRDIHDFISQVIKEPRFWDPELLSRFVNDTDWDNTEDAIASTFHYFEQD